MRLCIECGKALIGRSDKKFCSEMCRNSFHNKRNRGESVIQVTNRILLKNYRILHGFLAGNEREITIIRAKSEGFDFNLFTSVEFSASGEPCFYCYDTGYVILSDCRIKIVSPTNYFSLQSKI